jgi:hypothetical protein
MHLRQISMLPTRTRSRRPNYKARLAKLEAGIVESLRWLDVKAPGRAYTALQSALSKDREGP